MWSRVYLAGQLDQLLASLAATTDFICKNTLSDTFVCLTGPPMTE